MTHWVQLGLSGVQVRMGLRLAIGAKETRQESHPKEK